LIGSGTQVKIETLGALLKKETNNLEKFCEEKEGVLYE